MQKLQELLGEDGDDEDPSRHWQERKGEDRVPTPGQAADCRRAGALLAALAPNETVPGDKGFDTDAVLGQIRVAGASAVMVSKVNRTSPRSSGRETDRKRHPVVRFCGRIKAFRRVARRYDKTARHVLSTVQLAISRFLLRRIANRLNEFTAWTEYCNPIPVCPGGRGRNILNQMFRTVNRNALIAIVP